MKIQRLLESIKIGDLDLKNRMVMPPMNTNFSNENGSVTPQMTEYYVRRALGGVGLIVVEAVSIVPDVKNHGAQPMLYDNKYISGWANMVEKMHRYDTKVSVEIVHYGSEGALGPKYSASNVSGIPGALVKPLTIDEINEIEDKFAQTVLYAKIAGFDAVTLHAAHGYLIAQFLSPLYNKRTDQYGGSFENRFRFIKEIIRKCKEKVGSDFPIMVRFSGDEYIEGGRTVEDSIQIAKALEAEEIAALDLSACVPATYLFSISPASFPGMEGFLVQNARTIKSMVNIPVICAGGIRDPYFAEKILLDNSADLIALGRTLIADPDFCNKVKNGEMKYIKPCLSCQHCLEMIDDNLSLRCAVNAEAGREYEFTGIKKTNVLKKIVVVGSGPAGLEAARISALRGHEVTLFEEENEVGGSLNAAKLPPNKDNIRKLIEWYDVQLKKLGVALRLDTEYDEDIDRKLMPDVLIFATGATYARSIPGSRNDNVLTAIEALKKLDFTGKKIIIIGGGSTGCETAEFFANNKSIKIHRAKDFSGDLIYSTQVNKDAAGKDITIIEMLDDIGKDVDDQNRLIMKMNLHVNEVKILLNKKVIELQSKSITIEDINTSVRDIVPADTIILAGGLLPKKQMPFLTTAKNVLYVGDCKKPGKIVDAIYQAYYQTAVI